MENSHYSKSLCSRCELNESCNVGKGLIILFCGRYIKRGLEKNIKKMNLTIMAVTKMKGSHVCVAGINEEGEWIRPVRTDRLLVDDLFHEGKVVFEIYGIVNIYFRLHAPQPPHSEDWVVDWTRKLSRIGNKPL